MSRARLALLHDIVMAAAAFPLALFLRLGEQEFLAEPTQLFILGPLVSAGVCTGVFLFLGLYRGIWRYASLKDLISITRATLLAILLIYLALFLIQRLTAVPRSLAVIHWLTLMVLLGGPRFLYRLAKDRRLDLSEGYPRIPVLLVGADDNADLFIRATSRDGRSGYQVVGILALHPGRVGRDIQGIKVMGTLDDLPAAVKALAAKDRRPQRLVVTSDDVGGPQIRDLLDKADALGLVLARLPRLTDFKSGFDDRVEVRPIAVEDLLGRPQTVLDRDRMRAMIAGKRVLVTGAGGTIGGELVRQIAAFDPAHLTLFDNGEFALYQIDLELSGIHPGLSRHAVLGDVRDGERLKDTFTREQPELVFHAAALKHVPLVEANPCEGVITNVIGTRNVADACRFFGVARMVLISTDKAINPTSVMGACKRLAECYCQSLDLLESRTVFVTVRFGNVLGSTGSVVPLFERQLRAGGPLTVTHPDIKRYFMTVREAVELVLQAATLEHAQNARGKILVLDMGEPVRILDLARQMIRLAGLRPDLDVKIEITGLRPGEKLFEELFHDAEPAMPTAAKGILLAAPRVVDHGVLAPALDRLEAVGRAQAVAETLQLLQHLVPEYQPAAHGNALTALPQ